MQRKALLVVLVSGLLVVLGAHQVFGQSLKGMSLNGSTGLMSIPSGRIGWEHSANLGFDLGYHAVFDDGDTAHIPKASLSLFKLAEISFAYDTHRTSDDSAMVIGAKIGLPTGRTAIAIGGNVQLLEVRGNDENTQQVYLAATYPGTFFGMPAETTMVVGKSFGDFGPGTRDEDIDFGMGFDLQLFPDIFQGYVHWINDFANFSYSSYPVGADAASRGVFNTGIRIDIAANPALSRYKFVIDAMLTDALDDNRAFALGLAFGAPIM